MESVCENTDMLTVKVNVKNIYFIIKYSSSENNFIISEIGRFPGLHPVDRLPINETDSDIKNFNKYHKVTKLTVAETAPDFNGIPFLPFSGIEKSSTKTSIQM